MTDVNSAHVHPSKAVIATGDDFGFVKLFKFPSTQKYSKCKSYNGHSAHVTNVRFTADGQYLLSIGWHLSCEILQTSTK